MKRLLWIFWAAVMALVALCLVIPGIRARRSLIDERLMSEDRWQSSGLSESLAKNPSWRAVRIVARIDLVRDPLNVIPDVHPGDEMIGTYLFDADALDTIDTDQAVGKYQFSQPPFGVVLKVGRYAFGTDSRDVEFDINVGNHGFGDSFYFESRTNVVQPTRLNAGRTGRVTHILWNLADSSGSALSSDRLPSGLLELAAWDSGIGLRIEGIVEGDASGSEGFFRIVATVIRSETHDP